METLEQLNQRIESFQDLQSIVSTMKALSAVSIRQYEQAAHSLNLYYRTVELGLHVLLQNAALSETVLPQGDGGGVGAIVFGSDQGLCGRFNEEIVGFATERLKTAPIPQNQEAFVLAVGSRAAGNLEQAGYGLTEDIPTPDSASRITATVQHLLLSIDAWREDHGIDHVYLFYNRRQEEASRYQATGVQLLPVNLGRFRRLQKETWPSRSLPTYTMDRRQLLSALLRQYFAVTLFRACAESLASEHGSRLSAMQSAEKNLEERLEEVTAEYHRMRQDAITGELLDVVSGFEALKDDES
jgi:F-type H+-transporting ATPase subunit gamma